MTKITNTSNGPIAFVVGRDSDGSVKVKTLEPGEAKTLPIAEDRPDVVGYAHAGAISIGDKTKTAGAKDAPAPKPAPASKSNEPAS